MNIMLDLETMGSTPTAAIVSIGAVKFTADDGIIDEFYRAVQLKSSAEAGLTIDPDTISWWMCQSDNARRAIITPNAVPLHRALYDFTQFVLANEGDLYVWGNGADFDNVILANAYRALDLTIPWPYWSNRCYRTIKSLYPHIKIERRGTHHNALDDARNQAEHLLRIIDSAGLTGAAL